jgi:hypothetical protein
LILSQDVAKIKYVSQFDYKKYNTTIYMNQDNILQCIKDQEVITILQQIYQETLPLSIFLYGSAGQNDMVPNHSDYEVGIIYNKNSKVSRSDLAKMHNSTILSIYPFVFEDLESGFVDTVFPQVLYMHQIKLGSKLIFGRDILGSFVLTPITTIDLLERSAFDCGSALSAHIIFRDGDKNLAQSFVSKSCLYATRNLIILKLSYFPTSYTEIFELAIANSQELGIEPNDVALINSAYKVRNKKEVLDSSLVFANLKYVNRVKNQIRNEIDKNGNIKIDISNV